MRRRSPIDRLQDRYSAQAGPQMYESHNLGLADPFAARVIRPLIQRLSTYAVKIASRREQGQMAELLAKAGYPGGLTINGVQGLRMLMVLVLPIGAAIVLASLRSVLGLQESVPAVLILLGALMVAIVAWVSMPFILRRMVRKRQLDIARGLPDVLDLITIAVEAGLGFDAASDRVASRYKGPMGDELLRTNNEIRLGRPWAEAMRDMGERTGVEDLRSLIAALVQSRELGVNLANVLKAQSLRLREERARRAREAAQKTPTKILFPLVFLIFPPLFIVLMGPAVLRAIDMLKGADIFPKK